MIPDTLDDEENDPELREPGYEAVGKLLDPVGPTVDESLHG